MFNLRSPLFTRVSKWMVGAMISGLLISLPIVSPTFIPSAVAGASPSADLDTIATYLRNYQATDLRNSNFYSYSLDGFCNSIPWHSLGSLWFINFVKRSREYE